MPGSLATRADKGANVGAELPAEMLLEIKVTRSQEYVGRKFGIGDGTVAAGYCPHGALDIESHVRGDAGGNHDVTDGEGSSRRFRCARVKVHDVGKKSPIASSQLEGSHGGNIEVVEDLMGVNGDVRLGARWKRRRPFEDGEIAVKDGAKLPLIWRRLRRSRKDGTAEKNRCALCEYACRIPSAGHGSFPA